MCSRARSSDVVLARAFQIEPCINAAPAARDIFSMTNILCSEN